MKPIIGILETLKINDIDMPYDNYYKLTNIYVDKISKEGGASLGILTADEEILDKCDGFLFTGGNKITIEHYKIIEYAIKNNKPLLGICAGMQALAMYDLLSSKCTNLNPTYKDIYNKYLELKEKNISILEKVDNHGGLLSSGKIEATAKNIINSKHNINIHEDSILYNIYSKNILDVISMHGYGVYNTDKLFIPIARAKDNVIEALQYIDKNKFILGVQFHIELENNNPIIKKFINECKKTMN